MTTLYAIAGERVYGTRTRNNQVEDWHVCTVRHDIYVEELPDFPACLGDWQLPSPPVTKQIYTDGTTTKFVEIGQHGGGNAPMFGVEWCGESWWRPFDRGHDRQTMNYDLRFRGTNGTCTWGTDRLGTGT